MSSKTVLVAMVAAASASVLELPVIIHSTYSSVEFQIGTPPKPFRFMFDTGSASSWVTGSNCTMDQCPNRSGYNRIQYNPADSSTSQFLDAYSDIPYIADDAITGWAFEDVFTDEKSHLKWNQTFLAVNESSWRFITADGFLGLGFSSIAEKKTSTLVETLLWDGQLDSSRFALYYGSNMGDNGSQNGVLTIGGSHEDKYVDGEMVYMPLRNESDYQLWRVPLRHVNILSAYQNSTVQTHIGQAPTTNAPAGTYPKFNTTWNIWDPSGVGAAVFDTGAGRISVPPDIVGPVYFNLGWNYTKLMNGEERMDCQHMNSSWALSYTFGDGNDESKDVTISIRGDEFLRPGDQCMPPIDDSGTGGFALIGSAFLRRFYSVYEFGGKEVGNYQPKIGFGKLKEEFDYLKLRGDS